MKREYHKWWSENLQRDMEMLVFGHAGAKMLVFPTRDGRFYEYEKLGMINMLKHKIELGYLQVYCIDAIYSESFYCSWAHPSGRINRHIEFERYVLEEALPFMDSQNAHDCTISHGLSLGAYYAVTIAFRHPDLFKKVVAFSGRYDLTLNVEDFNDLLSGFYNEAVYFHTPSHFLPNLQCEHLLDKLRKMDIILVIGRDDPFLHNNQQLSDVLWQKNIHHQLHVWDDRAHSGYYWRRMAKIYI